MKKCISLFLKFAVIIANCSACGNNNDSENYVYFSEYILSAEVTNKNTRNISIDNVGRRLNFELSNLESKDDVNIKLTLAEGVSMASGQAQANYNLNNSAKIRLSGGGSVVEFAINVSGFNPVQENTEGLIRVSSYNIRFDTPRDIETGNSWDVRKIHVKMLILSHDFDIVGTQEGFEHQLRYLCEDTDYAFTGNGRDGPSLGEHSAIMYKTDRFVLLDAGDFWMSQTPDVPSKGWDADCCNRICSWAKFRDLNTQKEFYVFNVHFDNRGVLARAESAKLIKQKINEIADNAPVIFTGDLNTTPETEPVQTIRSFLNDAFEVTITPPQGPVGTLSGFLVANAQFIRRIDYVFVSQHFKVLNYAALTDSYNQRFPSDHLPVVADVIME